MSEQPVLNDMPNHSEIQAEPEAKVFGDLPDPSEARKVIAENDIIEISAADQKRFVEALLKPKAPTTAMKNAAQAHRQLIEPS